MRPIVSVLCAVTLFFAVDVDAAPRRRPKKPVAVPTAATPAPEAAPASSDSGPSQVRGPTRIDFDDRLIQGQSNKSGAVYLYDRKELKVRSMIKKRENFRDEIVGSLYDS
jgi:hypothetical protein